jgi:FeS assembly SUF system regulator
MPCDAVLTLNKLSDYAIVVASCLAASAGGQATARTLAQATRIPLPTVVKLLKIITAGGVLESIQGRNGGYRLARAPAGISLAEIIEAVEGPIALTECNRGASGCRVEAICGVRGHWLVINTAIRQTLAAINLADLASRCPGRALGDRWPRPARSVLTCGKPMSHPRRVDGDAMKGITDQLRSNPPRTDWGTCATRFSALHQRRRCPLAYLDNAATTQKPRDVIDAVSRYYGKDNANVRRGVHVLAERATAAYEGAREKVRHFLNARSVGEIVFLRGTTEAINLVASGLGSRLRSGDEIVLTLLEHHANIVPWQLLRERCGVVLRVLPVTPAGELEPERLAGQFNERTRLLALTHVSNVLGTVNPVAEMVQVAHRHGIPVLIDGAQAVPHLMVDAGTDCDFYCFSGHKMFGPTGIGVLCGSAALLDAPRPPGQRQRSAGLRADRFC